MLFSRSLLGSQAKRTGGTSGAGPKSYSFQPCLHHEVSTVALEDQRESPNTKPTGTEDAVHWFQCIILRSVGSGRRAHFSSLSKL